VTREKLKDLLAEYGRVAIGTYLVIFLFTLAGFALAIAYGIKVEGAQGGAGLLVASWVATKLTQPLRIAATLALTPIVAAGLKKLRKTPDAATATPEPPAGKLEDSSLP